MVELTASNGVDESRLARVRRTTKPAPQSRVKGVAMAGVLDAKDVRRFGVEEAAYRGWFRVQVGGDIATTLPPLLLWSTTRALSAADPGFVTEWDLDGDATGFGSCSPHPVDRRSQVTAVGADSQALQ